MNNGVNPSYCHDPPLLIPWAHPPTRSESIMSEEKYTGPITNSYGGGRANGYRNTGRAHCWVHEHRNHQPRDGTRRQRGNDDTLASTGLL